MGFNHCLKEVHKYTSIKLTTIA
uniref:Uncharacterized protein n=1 Tax=Rhizophora mucronata TaxID=61149 RepID=A0A2P2R453_RHIMU